MIDHIFTKFKNAREKRIIYNPRSGLEMDQALNHRTPVYKYSELCRLGEKYGPTRMLSHMFRRSRDNVILLQDPDDMTSGHWISVSCKPKEKEIYFFSTYGGKPDVEKIKWMTEDSLRESGQFMNIFNDGLKDLQNHGWEIHYNDYPYQKPNDKTAVCGIYTAAFLRSGLNPDEFENETLKIARRGINPAVFYYDRYFK